MSKILYYIFGYKQVVNATLTKFTRAGWNRIRQVAVGPKSYITRHDEPGHFVISTMDGIEQNVNLSEYVIN